MHPGPLQKTLNKMPVLAEFRFQQHHAIQDDTSGESNVCFGTQKPYLIRFLLLLLKFSLEGPCL